MTKMSDTKETKTQKRLKRMAAKEGTRLELISKTNVDKMIKVIKILPEKLTKHRNQKKSS